MKKLIFIVVAAVLFAGCSLDSSSEINTTYAFVPITGNDLPESFEMGKTYEVTVDYQLPSECYAFNTLDARRKGNTTEERTKIYVGAISSVDLSSNCDDTTEGASGTSKFSIFIDDDQDYIFNFWIGEDSLGSPQYQTVTVPVEETATQ